MRRARFSARRKRKAALAVLGATLLAALALAAPAVAAVRSEGTPILVPQFGPASPYPAVLNVSGFTGVVTDVNVTLKDVNHSWPSDLDVLLVGPGGQKATLMGQVGGDSTVRNAFLTFDDEAAGPLTTGQIVSGSYRPTDLATENALPGPAPAPPYGASLGVFDGASPNGGWKLFVADNSGGDKGSIAGGFSLNIKTDTPPANDFFASLQPLPEIGSSISGNNFAATMETSERPTFFGAQHSVWYSWTATNAGPTTVDTCSSDFDTALVVGTGTAVNALQTRASDDDGCASPNRLGSRLFFDAVAGQGYKIQVLGRNVDEEGTFTLNVAGNTPPDVAITSPASKTRLRRPPVNATVKDAQRALAATNVKLFVDNVEQPGFAYDPATGALNYVPTSKLSYGKHTVRVEATDPSGLQTVRSRTFTVLRPR